MHTSLDSLSLDSQLALPSQRCKLSHLVSQTSSSPSLPYFCNNYPSPSYWNSKPQKSSLVLFFFFSLPSSHYQVQRSLPQCPSKFFLLLPPSLLSRPAPALESLIIASLVICSPSVSPHFNPARFIFMTWYFPAQRLVIDPSCLPGGVDSLAWPPEPTHRPTLLLHVFLTYPAFLTFMSVHALPLA